MTDVKFKTDSRIPLKKPVFFFGDNIGEGGYVLHDGDYKWLRQIGDRKFFLPNMERMYPLSYLQHMSVPRAMEWDLADLFPVSLLAYWAPGRCTRVDTGRRSLVYFLDYSGPITQ